jgi:hypothetical protein
MSNLTCPKWCISGFFYACALWVFKLGIFLLDLLVQKAKNSINLCHLVDCYIRFFEHLRTKLNVVKEIDGFLNVDTKIDGLLC